MSSVHPRDAAATAAVFGFFASGWFGWAQNAPTASFWLVGGSMLGLLVAAVGLFVAVRKRASGTAFDRPTSKRFGVVVGVEFALAGIGALVLGVVGEAQLIAAWVALIVGVHLFPLASLLHYRFLAVPAVLVTLVALGAVPLALSRGAQVSTVAGIGTGLVLVGSAIYSLIDAERRSHQREW